MKSNRILGLSNAQWAMVKKDIREVTGSAQTIAPLAIVPLVMMVVLPLALVISAQFGEAGLAGINGFEMMVKNLGDLFAGNTPAQTIMNIGVNIMFPTLFLLIPIMCASVMGASSFVGEKEHKTLESLMFTPMTIRQIFVSKVVGTALLSYAVAFVAVVLFGIVINIGGLMYFSHLIFPNWKWVILMFWVTPAVTVLGIGFMVRVSAKAKTFQDAQQMSGFIVLPIILLLVGQATGLFFLNELMMFLLGLVLWIVDLWLMRTASKNYAPESMI